MKIPFDIEKAKAGAKVVTRDGRPVEIFKYDFKDNGKLRIAYCCTDEYGDNHAYLVNHNGVWMEAKESDQDLFIEEEQTYRPYANAAEMEAAIKEHGMFVKNKGIEKIMAIIAYSESYIETISGCDDYQSLHLSCTWLDGTPCGVQEGGEE